MAGAARRSTTSCASSTIFRARPSSGSSATTAPPATSWPPPPLSSPIMRAVSARRCVTEDEPGEKVTITGAWDSEEEARLIGEEIEALQQKGHSPRPRSPILVRISAQMREIEDRFITLGLPYRVIGGPRFYERPEIRDALAYLRCVTPTPPTTSPSSASSTRRSAASATRRSNCCTAMRARQGVPLMQAARLIVETEELKPKPREQRCAISSPPSPAGRTRIETMQHTRACRADPGGVRLHRACGRRTARPKRRAAREPERARPLHGGIPRPRRLPRACLAGDGGDDNDAPNASPS